MLLIVFGLKLSRLLGFSGYILQKNLPIEIQKIAQKDITFKGNKFKHILKSKSKIDFLVSFLSMIILFFEYLTFQLF